MTPWFVVFLKELRDASRDRRALMSLLILPVMGPLMIYYLFNMIIDIGERALDVDLPVVGAQNAPDLIDHLRQNGIGIDELDDLPAGDPSAIDSIDMDSELRRRIAIREHDFVLMIPEDFGARIADSSSSTVELLYDSSRTASTAKVGRVQALIDAWGRENAALRLMIRGIDPALIRPVIVGRIDVATAQARAQALLSMIPMLVIVAAFMSGVGIAVDATAGERERKSLEPLLVNPVHRSRIVLGKWLAAVVFSVTGLVFVMSGNLYAMSQVPLEQLGVSFLIGPAEIGGMLLVTVPIAFFATSLQMFVGLFARSFKDAQVYIGLMSFLPVLPFFYNMMNTEGRETWMSLVPMLGQNMLLTDVLSGRPPAFADMALAVLALLFWSLLFVLLATHMLRRERIIFA
ncbi:MAG: ABC transporter permease [Gammaproteobacteria bacterium]